MSRRARSLALKSLGLSGVKLEVRYAGSRGEEKNFYPESFRVSNEGFFLSWPNAPDLQVVSVTWKECPFLAPEMTVSCRVTERSKEGLEVVFDRAAPVALTDWLESAASVLSREIPEAAVRTSRLYTLATVVSAFGLFSGALAILLPIVVGDRGWVDSVAKGLLLLMVVSIGAFAVVRALAGKAEVRAITQNRG